MKYINLTQNKKAMIDDEDFDRLSKIKWCAARVYRDIFYAYNGNLGYMHNFIVGYKYVDHINGNGLDNRKQNLRKSNHSFNAMNKKASIGKKYKGVYRHKYSWVVVIWKNRKSNYIGSYKTELEAAISYNNAAISMFGEYARLNEL